MEGVWVREGPVFHRPEPTHPYCMAAERLFDTPSYQTGSESSEVNGEGGKGVVFCKKFRYPYA